MDGFIRKVNQKVNLPGFAILKDGFLKTRPIKRFQICLKMYYKFSYQMLADVYIYIVL